MALFTVIQSYNRQLGPIDLASRLLKRLTWSKTTVYKSYRPNHGKVQRTKFAFLRYDHSQTGRCWLFFMKGKQVFVLFVGWLVA